MCRSLRRLVAAIALLASLALVQSTAGPASAADPTAEEASSVRRDRVAVVAPGMLDVAGEAVDGDVVVTDSFLDGGVDGVRGTVTLDDGTTVRFDVARPAPVGFAVGNVSVAGRAAPTVSATVLGPLRQAGENVSGTAYWFAPGPFLPVLRSLRWQVEDVRPGPGWHDERFVLDGRARRALVHLPATYDDSPVPVLLALHGAGSPTAWAQELFVGLRDTADREGFALVLGEGVNARWNSAGGPGANPGHEDGVDDLAYVSTVLDRIEARFAVDTQRIYATGFSNGGGMTHRLACAMADRIAAFAPLHITKNTTYPCEPGRPVPILLMAATGDLFVDYGVPSEGRLTIEEGVAFWAGENGCDPDPVVTPVPDTVPTDGSTAETWTYTGCAEGGEVEFVKITGGGHNWPGKPPFLPEFLVGGQIWDFDGNDAVWDFVSRYRLP